VGRGRRRPAAAKGQGLLEFALLTPLVLLLILGTIDGSRALMTYVMMTNAVRDGARYSVVNAGPALYPCTYQAGDPSDALHCAAVIAAALRSAPTLTRASVSRVTLAYNFVGALEGSGGTLEARVTMSDTFQPLTLLILGGHMLTLTTSATYLRQ